MARKRRINSLHNIKMLGEAQKHVWTFQRSILNYLWRYSDNNNTNSNNMTSTYRVLSAMAPKRRNTSFNSTDISQKQEMGTSVNNGLPYKSMLWSHNAIIVGWLPACCTRSTQSDASDGV